MLIALASDRRPVGLMALGDAFASVIVSLGVALAVAVLVASFLAERRGTGDPSFISRWAARLAARDGRPIWDRLPFLMVLTGLAVALLGWRALSDSGPLLVAGTPLAVVGLGIALLGGVAAGAMAHPPRSVVEHADGEIARPTPAHRPVTRRGRLGAGPVGGAMVVAGGVLALVATPVASVFRLFGGNAVADAMPAHALVLAAVGLICLGGWLLHAEGTAAAHHGAGATHRHADPADHARSADRAELPGHAVRPDLAEAAAAGSVLLALSVAVDSGVPTAVAGVLGLVALVVVRVRGGAGSALLAGLGYVAVRLAVAVLTWSFGAPLVPLAWAAVAAAVAVELLGGLLHVGRASRHPSSPVSVR